MNIIVEIQEYLERYDALRHDRNERENKRLMILNGLTKYHMEHCDEYSKFIETMISPMNLKADRVENIPLIPVSLFKEVRLKSVHEDSIYRILKSSGTTGKPSQILLDKINAINQSKALSRIFSDFLGLVRPNILVVDSPSMLNQTQDYTARKAGIVGFGSLCRKRFFALNDDMSINIQAIIECIESNEEEFLVYGFTYILWLYFMQSQIPDSIKEAFKRRAVLLHGGGWKKLTDLDISNNDFRNRVKSNLGISRIHEYYGMVEQTGSVFMSCHYGVLHENALATIIARDARNIFKEVKDGSEGIAQVLSCLPTSYPGHSLITEDLTTIQSNKKCLCGRTGKTFKINGRIKRSEVRGCSDTFSEPV